MWIGRNRRRVLTAAAALAVMLLAVAAMQRKAPPTEHVFRVTLGLKDAAATDWNGQVSVKDGEVSAITGWRFEDKDAVDAQSGWKCKTHLHIAPEDRYPLTPAKGKAKEPPLQPWPNGVTLTIRGDTPAVTIKLTKGEITFRTAELKLGRPAMFLGDQVRVERLPETRLLRPPAAKNTVDPVQDDYPAFWVRYKTGKQYLAWVAYQKKKDRVLLVERDGPDGEWSEPREVDGPGDHFRVALASLHDDTLWVVWSAQHEGQWNLYGRSYKDGKLGDAKQITTGKGPNLWHRMTTDRFGRGWLVWQSFRNGQSDILARCVDTEGWHETIEVAVGKGNKWDPAIAADHKADRVWIGWDSYETGEYTVALRSISGGPGGKLSEVTRPGSDSKRAAHISLTCDRDGRVWAAWDEAGSQWGKDTGYLYPPRKLGTSSLYDRRSIKVQVLVDGQWKAPADFDQVLPADMKEFNELPQLQEDTDGRMWLAFRHRTCRHPRIDNWAIQGRWDCYATAYLGDGWLPLVELAQSGGRDDMRIGSQRDPDGNVYFAYASDNRGWMPPSMSPRNLSIAVSKLKGAPPPGRMAFHDRDSATVEVKRVHPHEKEQVARIRDHKIDTGGHTYRIYRGDLHRHTDISSDGIGDGSLMDLHRYALDAAALDFAIVSDHNMGDDNEYCWWRTQKANDLYTVPGSFISMYGYERSVAYPNGHRNVIWTERGHRTLPLPRPGTPKQMEEDTGKLYEYLRRTNGICTAHTSATNQGTNWEEFDGALEPIVELFQGYHAAYEALGAPKSIDENSDYIHGGYKPDGFVNRALDKGYKLGFQSSSDHISTHVSYACVLAEEFSRKGLVEAMRKRHTYAATDNIVLDVRMGAGHIMGDQVTTSEPELSVVVLGTGALDRVEVLRNGDIVHTEKPDGSEARFRWRDPAPRKGEKPSYYYVRVIQKDSQMAWASPIWVTVPE